MKEQERLQSLMAEEHLNAKDFAEQVGISTATMSNILNGRNNPSLEVLQKVLNRFRMVSSDWLILGVGSMYREKNDSREPKLFDIRPNDETNNESQIQDPIAGNTLPIINNLNNKKKQDLQIIEKPVQKNVTKVMIFYDDGTFEELLR